MDKSFCIDTLNEAITLYPKPDIFNSYQGSRTIEATTAHEGG